MIYYPGKVPRNFFYIDHKGITSLVAQCNSYIENEKIITQGIMNKRKTSLDIAIKALAIIFGSAKLNTRIEQNSSIEQRSDRKFSKEIENHLDELINYLAKNDQLKIFNGVNNLVTMNESNFPLFCIGKMRFSLDKEYYMERDYNCTILNSYGIIEGDIRRYVEKQQYLVLNADLMNFLSPAYNWKRIILGASVEKCLSGLGRSTHLSLFLAESLSHPINISFFGHITKMATSLYIKPYAIWNIGE